MIMQGYLNTLKILAMSMVVQLTMTAIGAYFFPDPMLCLRDH